MGPDGRVVTKSVVGPEGALLTLRDLPPAGFKRWVSRRKAEVVLAVEGGLLTLDEARARYSLTIEEFLEWELRLRRYGLDGLKVTHTQQLRPSFRN